MAVLPANDGTETMRQKIQLAERQARVGIVANPATVHLPVIAPRETMARWPDLRSPRRLRRLGLAPRSASDSGLSERALDDFADEIRQKRRAGRGLFGFVQTLVRWPGTQG